MSAAWQMSMAMRQHNNTEHLETTVAKAKSPEREERIEMEIVVDAYGPEERAIGWYCYLEDKLSFPFTATCTAVRAISPLKNGDEVEVLAMAESDECQHEMFVMIRSGGKEKLGVPLSQLKPTSDTDEATIQAVEDWRYWVGQGYEF